jgi:uncharacterized protein (DUF2141 family)
VLLAALGAPAAVGQGKGTATLTIRIERVTEKRGTIRLALYERANWAGRDGETVAEAVVPATPGETVVTLTGLEPGIYAIKTFQDENQDEKMDFNWIGIPLERFGFSNDARPLLDQPGFDEAKFQVRPGANQMTINLRSLF